MKIDGSINEYMHSESLQKEKEYYNLLAVPAIAMDSKEKIHLQQQTYYNYFPAKETQNLLTTVPNAYHTQINDRH